MEMQSAMSRAANRSDYTILPVRLDDSPVGMLSSINYLDLRNNSIKHIAELIEQKVRSETKSKPATKEPDSRVMHIISREREWAVKREGASRALRKFADKRKAIDHAKALLEKSQASEIVVHNNDGTVEERITLTSDDDGDTS